MQFLICVEFFFSHGKAVSELREMNIVTSFSVCVKLKIYIVREDRNCRCFETECCKAYLSPTINMKLVVKRRINFMICTFQVIFLWELT